MFSEWIRGRQSGELVGIMTYDLSACSDTLDPDILHKTLIFLVLIIGVVPGSTHICPTAITVSYYQEYYQA